MTSNRLFLYFLILAIILPILNSTISFVEYPFQPVDLKALGNFNFDQANGVVADIPARIRSLDGRKVQLTGFMWSPTSAPKVNTFQFIYNFVDGFGRRPLVHQRIFANVGHGKVALSDNYLSIEGTLHIQLKRAGGQVISVFEMDVDTIRSDHIRLYPTPINLTPGGAVQFQPPLTLKDVVELATYACWGFGALSGLLCAYRSIRSRCAVAAGRCPQCGFDLRASVDRCPECGSREGFRKRKPATQESIS